MNAPTNTIIQNLAQGGPGVAIALALACLLIGGGFVTLAIVLEVREARRQKQLAESQERARRPIIGPHWADQNTDRR